MSARQEMPSWPGRGTGAVRPLFAAALLAGLAWPTQAANLDAGALLQNNPPQPQALPQAQPPARLKPLVDVPEPVAAPAVAGMAFRVNRIKVTGNRQIATETLDDLLRDVGGQDLTLAQLDQVCARITDYYRSLGYLLTRAFVPAQTLTDGVVEVRVAEVRYGQITVENHGPASDALLRATLSDLQPGLAIAAGPLEHALLLVSDLPGLLAESTLRPGAEPGTSDLTLTTSAAARTAGLVAIDDYGSQATGRGRISAALSLFDPLQLGSSDMLGISALHSGPALNHWRLAYEAVLSGNGTRVGAATSGLRYALDGAVASAQASGSAKVNSLWLRQPMLRQREGKLAWQMGYEDLQCADVTADTAQRGRQVRNWTFSLNGDVNDGLFGGVASTAFSVGLSRGQVGFQDLSSQGLDEVTGKVQGGFTKLTLSVTRLQSLARDQSLRLTLSTQSTNQNLDPSQKLSVGGPASLRAYDSGVASGDAGYLLGVEYRHDWHVASAGQLQALVFAEHASLTVNKKTWTADVNTVQLTDVGVGLNWDSGQQWHARAFIAKAIGRPLVGAGEHPSLRFRTELGRAF